MTAVRYPIDPHRTGEQIAVQHLREKLERMQIEGLDAVGIAKALPRELRALEYSVVLIQQGRLSQLLDGVNAALAANQKLEHKIAELEKLRPEIETLKTLLG